MKKALVIGLAGLLMLGSPVFAGANDLAELGRALLGVAIVTTAVVGANVAVNVLDEALTPRRYRTCQPAVACVQSPVVVLEPRYFNGGNATMSIEDWERRDAERARRIVRHDYDDEAYWNGQYVHQSSPPQERWRENERPRYQQFRSQVRTESSRRDTSPTQVRFQGERPQERQRAPARSMDDARAEYHRWNPR